MKFEGIVMKMLMIGMDGAQVSTFMRGWTPYIASLIDKGSRLNLKEDLLSRGWNEIVTGESGVTTGALYNRAVLNGTYAWTLKFELGDIPGLGHAVKPIWQVLNERNYRVGIMNVPTTYPAPSVKGFFVSGGGGGKAVTQEATNKHCYPDEVLKFLLESGYIVDERLDSLLIEKKLYKPFDFFSRLVEKNERRTQTFIDLANRYLIDFGFVIFRSSANLAEFLLLPTWEAYIKGEPNIDLAFIDAVKFYYQRFDEQIKRLVESFQGAEVVFVADHSMAKRIYSVNFNSFLQEIGYQKPSNSSRRTVDFVKRYKKWIPFSLRTALKRNSKTKSAFQSMSMVSFDPKTSLAFSMIIADNVRGIFINDKTRFGGPVLNEEIPKVKEEIIDIFNTHPTSIKYRFSAYSKPNTQTNSSQYFPDIIIDLPDGYTASNDSKAFVSKFETPKGPLGISSVTKGQLLCGKAHYPIAVTTNEWKVKVTPEKQDLRLIYDHILEVFK